jgi:adenosylhomocysteine nucleosidase
MEKSLEKGREAPIQVVVVVSADAEWQAVRQTFPRGTFRPSPFGEWFRASLTHDLDEWSVIFFHGGWGKIAAAASTQYALDQWHPRILVNLGTCGGIHGAVAQNTVLLVERTLVYDLVEQMGDAASATRHYTTNLDLSWLSGPDPVPVQRALLVSADRDLQVADLPMLRARYSAIAGDWESGAIAYVAQRNGCPCLILRGVTDVVGETGDETYGNLGLFAVQAQSMVTRLLTDLPLWLVNAAQLFRACCDDRKPHPFGSDAADSIGNQEAIETGLCEAVEVECIGPGDTSSAREIAHLGIIAWGRTPTPEELDRRTSEIAEELSTLDPERCCPFIARRSQDLVGFAWIWKHRDQPDAWMLLGLVVHLDCRRQSIGSRLTRACVSYAQQKGARSVLSETHADNSASIQFHEAFGFRNTGRSVAPDGDQKVGFELSVS